MLPPWSILYFWSDLIWLGDHLDILSSQLFWNWKQRQCYLGMKSRAWSQAALSSAVLSRCRDCGLVPSPQFPPLQGEGTTERLGFFRCKQKKSILKRPIWNFFTKRNLLWGYERAERIKWKEELGLRGVWTYGAPGSSKQDLWDVIRAPQPKWKTSNQISSFGLSTQDANSQEESEWTRWGPAFLSLMQGGQEKVRGPDWQAAVSEGGWVLK